VNCLLLIATAVGKDNLIHLCDRNLHDRPEEDQKQYEEKCASKDVEDSQGCDPIEDGYQHEQKKKTGKYDDRKNPSTQDGGLASPLRYQEKEGEDHHHDKGPRGKKRPAVSSQNGS
jgi:hypothetical protein